MFDYGQIKGNELICSGCGYKQAFDLEVDICAWGLSQKIVICLYGFVKRPLNLSIYIYIYNIYTILSLSLYIYTSRINIYTYTCVCFTLALNRCSFKYTIDFRLGRCHVTTFQNTGWTWRGGMVIWKRKYITGHLGCEFHVVKYHQIRSIFRPSRLS